MKILSIKTFTFHLICSEIPRIKFIDDDTLSDTKAIMTFNFRLAKLYIVNNLGDSRTAVTKDVNFLVL